MLVFLLSVCFLWLCRRVRRNQTENFRKNTKSLRLSERTATECCLNGIAWMFKPIPSSLLPPPSCAHTIKLNVCDVVSGEASRFNGNGNERTEVGIMLGATYSMINNDDDGDGERAACTGAVQTLYRQSTLEMLRAPHGKWWNIAVVCCCVRRTCDHYMMRECIFLRLR